MNIIKELSLRWKKVGINEGDTILLHSDITRLLMEFKKKNVKILPINILESFLESIGANGTLILPLFNFDFAKGIKFNFNKTPSKMGLLTEEARLYKGSVRTGHPIYSFAVIGYHSSLFYGLDNISAYSDESPFGLLRKLNGKIAILDLDDQNSMTFYHHIEEVYGVKYRYYKNFTGQYVDINGENKSKTYKIFVRDIENGIVTNVNPAGELMWKNGLYKGDRPREKTGLRLINSLEMFNFISELIKSNKAFNILYSIKK